jgi:NADPH-ferrihemoprotein reductase
LDRTLTELGGRRIGPLGLADESQATTEDDFMEWQEAILEELGQVIPLTERPITYKPALNVLDVCVDEQSLWMGEPSKAALLETTPKSVYNSNNPYPAPIAASKTLSSVPDRACVHMELSIADAPALRYETGDHLAVWPTNPDTEVEQLLRLLGLDDPSRRSQPIMIDRADATSSKLSLPSPTTREVLLKYYLEICAPVPRDSLVLTSLFAPTEAAKAKLLWLSRDKAAFRAEVGQRYATLGGVMELVAPGLVWSRMPFSLLIECFSRTQPRYYSISSSPLVQPRQPTITFAVDSRAILSTESSGTEGRFLGVATNFLLAHERSAMVKDTHHVDVPAAQLPSYPFVSNYDLQGPRNKLSGNRVYMHIRKSTFKLPLNPMIPIIMVAAGTGIAPYRGFVQERARIAELGKPVGKMLLFFGCRDDENDFLYKDEWKDRETQLGDAFKLMPCFSRLSTHKKTYVQDGLDEHKQLVAKMIEDGAAFYICGAATMARDVRSRLVQLIAEHKRQTVEETDIWVTAKLRKAGLYHEDVWG